MKIRLLVGVVALTTVAFTNEASGSFPIGGEIFFNMDNFRSLPDGSFGGNTGILGGINLAYLLPSKIQGIGLQGGGSFGFYDWDSRGSTDSKSIQLQGFATVGIFRYTPSDSGLNAGACYDWSFEGKYGVFELSPTLAQIRGQIGYLIKGGNELGFLGSYATQSSYKHVSAIPIQFRAVSQVNAFWRHIFKNGGETMFWGGSPYTKGLMYKSGRSGDYIVGARFKAPLTSHLSLQGHGVYMGSRNGSADQESRNYAANVCFGLSYSFGGSKSAAKPYMPIGDNSNFIVDTNNNI